MPFRIFLQDIKVIKLHDKEKREMVVNQSLARSHRLLPYLLFLHYLHCGLDYKYNPPSASVFSSGFLQRTSIQFAVCQPASQRCISIPVYPMSWSQPNSDLLLVIQLLHPAGLHSLGLLLGGTREDGCAVLSGGACSLLGEMKASLQYHAHFPP